VTDASLQGAGNNIEQSRLPRSVALNTRQALLVGPSAVAIHYQRHVRWQAGLVKRRRILLRPINGHE
jgi:hypothetical protein